MAKAAATHPRIRHSRPVLDVITISSSKLAEWNTEHGDRTTTPQGRGAAPPARSIRRAAEEPLTGNPVFLGAVPLDVRRVDCRASH
jgi:hypothetical protein